MKNKTQELGRWLRLAALIVAPGLLGAKGCGIGTVGSDVCGGLQGKDCSAGYFCHFDPEDSCGAADQTGLCQVTPAACTEQYAPVCGCDDVTYGNECMANAAGVSVGSSGECVKTPSPPSGTGTTPVPGTANPNPGPVPGKACGGLLGLSCAKDEYCNFPSTAACGAADQTGTCSAKPETCTADYTPVCGCDDKTYSNACTAGASGVSVASKGECVASNPGKVCGTRGVEPCATGEYCNFPDTAQCGQTDKPGTCAARPEVCTDIFSPVCGCDGASYSNACEANAAGVSVASNGKCGAPAGKSCGGLIGAMCAKGEFCNFPATAQCGAADQTGTCEMLPSGCPKNILQVCGCDGKTYDNACVANVAGVSVAAEGACKAAGKGCGARLGDTCSKGEFCHFPDAAICGRADGTGLCEVLPTACTKEYSAVCGCDGTTYSNPCMANSAGTSILKKGTCGDTGTSEKQCGGITGLSCAKGEYCDFAIEAQCGAADQLGTCRAKAEACTQDYVPVCGCDDKTYSNACAAAVAGISVATNGECKADPNCKPSLVAPANSCR